MCPGYRGLDQGGGIIIPSLRLLELSNTVWILRDAFLKWYYMVIMVINGNYMVLYGKNPVFS